MKIYLIRHGETDWNHELRFQGREDVPLNEAGIAQARDCGRALRGQGIEAVFISPLRRAARTGEVIAEELGLAQELVQPLEDLIERDLGEYSGAYVKDRQDYFAIAAGMDVPGMERFAEVLARMERALAQIGASGKAAVAAVSHGAAINVLLAGLSDGEVGTGKTKLYNGGITVLEGNNLDGYRIEQLNLKPECFAKQAHRL